MATVRPRQPPRARSIVPWLKYWHVRTWSIRTKLGLSFGLALAFVVAVGAIGGAQLLGFNRLAATIVDDWLPNMKELGAIKRAMVEHRLLAARELEAASWGQRTQAESEITVAEARHKAALANFNRLTTGPVEKSFLIQYTASWNAYWSAFREAAQFAGRGETDKARETFANRAEPAFETATVKIDELLGLSERSALAASKEANRIRADALWLMVGIILAGALGAGAAVWWINRNVSRPILQVSHAMRRLAAGDDSVRVGEGRQRSDEIGDLVEAALSYRASLRQLRLLSEQASLAHRHLDAATSNMAVGVCLFDAERRLVFANQAYADMYGLPAALMQPGTAWHDIVLFRVNNGVYGAEGRDKYVEHVQDTVDRTERFTELVSLADGRKINLIHQPLAEGGWVTTHDDVTDLKRNEERIYHLAHHDSLTDLPNRRALADRLNQLLAARADNPGIAVLCLDVDYLKSVNDTLGHPVGDALLKAIAQRLRSASRKGDTVARFGGDEFVVVQAGVDQPGNATELAQRIIDAVSAPYSIDGNEVVIGISVGIALGPAHGSTADQLINNGDVALYRAKAEGRGTYRFYEPDMDADVRARRLLELDLRRALPQSEFKLVYQPIVKLATGAIVAFEALLRWDHPQRGPIAPTDFIPVAEDVGLIKAIGEWVLHEACATAATWPGEIGVAVNLSPVQFRGNRLMTAVAAALAAGGLSPRRLELEVTESVLLGNTEATLALLSELRSLGVRIAMDDFGTGYSSLSYLRRFPFDKIKIDQSFIRDLADAGTSRAIVRAAAGLGSSLGVATTAEGVETKWQLGRIREEGCTEAQGYLLSRPVSADQIPGLLLRWELDWRRLAA